MDNNSKHNKDHDLLKYIVGESNQTEVKDIENWLAENPENRVRLKALEKIWHHAGSSSDFNDIDVKSDWEITKSRMHVKINTKAIATTKPIFPFVLRIAASVTLFLSIIYFSIHYFTSTPQSFIVSTLDQQKSVDLPDGSVVYINEYSEFSYPEKFSKNNRKVQLKGEAFFEVAKDSDKPFIIITDKNASIRVLGTSFNVNAKSNTREVIVQVVEGKVALFSTDNENNLVFLEKNETGILDNNSISKSLLQQDNSLSWKTGILTFDNTTFNRVIRDLIHHYKKPIILKNVDVDRYKITATFNNQPFNEVMDELMIILDLEYASRNDTIHIYENPR